MTELERLQHEVHALKRVVDGEDPHPEGVLIWQPKDVVLKYEQTIRAAVEGKVKAERVLEKVEAELRRNKPAANIVRNTQLLIEQYRESVTV